MDYSLFLMVRLITALCIGLTLGIERDVHAGREGKKRLMGIPVFTLISFLGFILVFTSSYKSLAILCMAFILILLFSFPGDDERRAAPGITTSVALVISFSIGIMSGLGFIIESIVITLICLSIMVVKEKTHRFAGLLTHQEIASALHFLVILVIILPLAYTMGDIHTLIGPGKLLDPVKILMMIIFVSTMSFTSYLIIRSIGSSKSIEISSFLGGFVNSAATTAFLAQRSGVNPIMRNTSLRGIILTNTSMMFKDIVLITVLIGIFFLRSLLVPIIVLIGISIIILCLMKKREDDFRGSDLELGTPFAVIPAAKFGFMFLIISVASFLGRSTMGDYGIYAASLGGLISTTSVSASLAAFYLTGEIELNVIITSFLFALAFGSISKVPIAYTYDRDLAKKIFIPQTVIAFTCVLMALLYHLAL